jgi:predicted component of type VI protein secretion system
LFGIDEKIETELSDFKDDIDNIRYETEQMCDSNISDMKEDILSEVETMVNDVVGDKLEELKQNGSTINNNDMRYINDMIKALVDERLCKAMTTVYQSVMKELNGYVQSTPPYKGD